MASDARATNRTQSGRWLGHARMLCTGLPAGALALVVGCASSPPQGAEHDLRSTVRLSARLMDASDSAATAFDNQVTEALLTDTDPKDLASLMTSRALSTAIIRAIVLGADPAGALVDLYVYSDLALWACENRMAMKVGFKLIPCQSTYGVLRKEAVALAKEYMSKEQIARVDAAIAKFKADHPNQLAIGLVRLSDLEGESGTTAIVLSEVAPSMFSPVTDAARQLQETRLLGYQALWLMSRLPTAMGWQIEASMYLGLASKPVSDLQSSTGRIATGLEGSSTSLESMTAVHRILNDQLQALQSRISQLESSLSSKAGLGEDLYDVSSSIDTLAGEASNLTGAERLVDRTVRTAAMIGVGLIALATASFGSVLWWHRRSTSPGRHAHSR